MNGTLGNPTSDIDWEFIGNETIIAGGKKYSTDRVSFIPPLGGEFNCVEVNHVNIDCPNCRTIGEMAIELRTESLICPICEHRIAFNPDTHLEAGVEINDQPIQK